MSRIPESQIPVHYNTDYLIGLIQKFIQGIVESSKNSTCKITGSCFFEDGIALPVPVMYSTFPSGNFIAWVMIEDYFHLLALVNDNVRHVVKIPVGEIAEFQKKIEELKGELE